MIEGQQGEGREALKELAEESSEQDAHKMENEPPRLAVTTYQQPQVIETGKDRFDFPMVVEQAFFTFGNGSLVFAPLAERLS